MAMAPRFTVAAAVALLVQVHAAVAERACAEGQPEAHTSSGVICGKVKIAVGSEIPYDSFQGIPYAEQPTGDLRFKPPAPHKGWEGVLDAQQASSECPQPFSPLGGSLSKGKEDCLYLNVFTPHERSKETPLSVMVWIHGGAFSMGSGGPVLYGPDHIVSRNVVVVTFNYRLGALGFLDLQTEGAPGNVGLLDQMAVLRWVQRDIAAFGGDPARVTIFGESAGGASAHILTLSPLSHGLFHQAILQSGVAVNVWAFKGPEQAAANARALLQHVGCPAEEHVPREEQVACLRGIPAARLVAPPAAARSPEDDELMLSIAFTPTLDGRVLPADPRTLLRNASRVPVMAGNTNREGFIALPILRTKGGYEKWQKALEAGVPARSFGLDATRMGPAFVQHFLDGEPLTKETEMKFAIAFGEWQFIEGNMEALRARLEGEAPPPQYLYFFTFNGTRNYAKMAFGAAGEEGAAHADDIFYIFHNSISAPLSDEAAPEVSVTGAMARLWTDFAKCGDPTPVDSSLPKWKPYTMEQPGHMLIGRDLSMVNGEINEEHRLFWKEFLEGSR